MNGWWLLIVEVLLILLVLIYRHRIAKQGRKP